MIDVRGVHFTYPSGTQALKGVDLKIEDGEFVAIMGENGAGKTTLIKHLNGIFKPSNGEVLIDGVDTKDSTIAEVSRKVGLVFQNPDHQLFSETVEEEVSFALKNFDYNQEVIDKRVTWALNLLNLENHRIESPFILSGGERKRVALAAILAWNPKVIVLDEPTIGQDYEQKERLRQLIIQLNSQGRTVIMVTHDVEFVADCEPRVILMSKGKVIGDGPALEILTDNKITNSASVLVPQIPSLMSLLKDRGTTHKILNYHDAKNDLLEIARRGQRNP
jgi:energy-coupling factor transport system ATP-binding protein